jgi:hypothetical protein
MIGMQKPTSSSRWVKTVLADDIPGDLHHAICKTH